MNIRTQCSLFCMMLVLCLSVSASQGPRKKPLTLQDFLPKTLADVLSPKNQRKELLKRTAIPDIVAAQKIETSSIAPVTDSQSESKNVIVTDLPGLFDIKKMEADLHNQQKELSKRTVADILDDMKKVELLKDSQPEEFHDKLANLCFEVANLEQIKRFEKAKYLEQFRLHANEAEEIKKSYQPLEGQIEQLKTENNFFPIIRLYEQLIVLSKSEKRSNHYQAELAKVKTLCLRQGIEQTIKNAAQTKNYAELIAAYGTLAETYDTVEEKSSIDQKISDIEKEIIENEYQEKLSIIEKEQQEITANKKTLDATGLHQASLCLKKKANLATKYPAHLQDHADDAKRADQLHWQALGRAKDKTLEEKIRKEFGK